MINLNKLKKISKGKYEIIKYCKNKKTLELGCVNHSLKDLKKQIKQGIWLFGYLNEYCSKAVGLDIVSEPAEYLITKGFDVRLGDAQSFHLNEKFDVIVASALLDHLLNFDGFMKSCNKNLKKSGELIIFEDNILSIPTLLYERFLKGGTLGMHGDITLKPLPITFNNFSGRYGFRVKKLEYISRRKIVKLIEKLVPRPLKLDELLYDHFICILEKTRNI